MWNHDSVPIKIFNQRKFLSQWQRGLRQELSLPAQTLGSWVRIPLEAWISVRVSSARVLSCVGSGLPSG
jgi:hypothetical protein